MDPVSTIASVLTLIGATGGTIKVIHDTITSIKDAPKDIRRQCKRLECLCVTLNSIVRTCQHLPDDCQVGIDLCGIEEFIDEAKALEANLNARRTRVAGKSIVKLHESCKWLFSDRQLKRFFESLDQWDTILSQALMVVQIAMSNRILTHTSSLMSLSHITLPTSAIAPQTSIVPHYDIPSQSTVSARSLPISMRNTYISERQLASLAKLVEPVGVVVNYQYQTQLWGFDLALHGGRVITKSWSRSESESYTTLVNSEGQHVSLIMAVPCITARRLKVSVVGFRTRSCGLTLNFRWNLRHHRILPYDHPCFVAIERGDTGYLQQHLSSKELLLSDCSAGGYSLLHFAVRYNRPAIVAILINEGLEADVRNDCGQTPLHIAVQQGTDIECARLLLNNGADAFQQDNEGRSALHYFYNDVVRQLLVYYADGIDPWMQDRHGLTILHWASWSSRSSHRALTCFPHKGEKQSCYGIKDQHGKSMLHYAVQRGNADLIAFLLASPDAATMSLPDLAGKTLLHYATESGRPDTINMMLERGIDLNVVDNQGRTALHHAATRGNLVAAQRLIDLGATRQLSYKDQNDNTPVDLACQYASKSVLDFFESLGHSGLDSGKRGACLSWDINVPCNKAQSASWKIMIVVFVVPVVMYWKFFATARREGGLIELRI